MHIIPFASQKRSILLILIALFVVMSVPSDLVPTVTADAHTKTGTAASSGVITALTGNGQESSFPGSTSIDRQSLGTAPGTIQTLAKMGLAWDVAVDGSGVLYATADFKGLFKFGADGSMTKLTSQIYGPIAIDRFGNIYGPIGQGVFELPVGSTQPRLIAGSLDLNIATTYTGDGGPASKATFEELTDVAVGPGGDLFLVDSWAGVIRRIDPAGNISTYAIIDPPRPPDVAEANAPPDPYGVAVAPNGDLYVSEIHSYAIKRVDHTTRAITTFAGGGDGLMDMDQAGNLYVANDGSFQVVRIDPNGHTTVIAGNGSFGTDGDGGPATEANLEQPTGVAVDAAGNLYIADRGGGGLPDSGDVRMVVNAAGGPIGGPIMPSETYGRANPSESCICDERQATSNPVNTATGNFWHTFADFEIPGRGIPLSLTHTYNSQEASVDGPLGYGWTDSYNLFLSISADAVTVHQENGSQVTFTQNGSGYTAPPRVLATLVKNTDGSYIFTRKKTTIFSFDATGKLTSEADLNGYVTRVSHPSAASMVVTDPAGRSLSFSLAGPHVTSVTDPAGRNFSFHYDPQGNLASVRDPAGGTTAFTYDSIHQMLSMRLPNGGQVANHYDGQGRVDAQTDELGRKTTFDYNSVPGSTIVTDPAGHATLDVYVAGELVAETRSYGTPSALTMKYSYHMKTAALLSITDSLGKTARAGYDASGNVISTVDVAGRRTRASYNSFSEPVSTTDVTGQTITTTYDARGNIMSITRQPSPGTSGTSQNLSYRYDDSSHPGDITSATDQLGHRSTFSYDSVGNLITSTDADGNTTTYSYNRIGELSSLTSPRGNTTTYMYDRAGFLIAVREPGWDRIHPLAHATSFSYDVQGNLTSTSAAGSSTAYHYDLANEVIEVDRPDHSTLRYTYFPDGSLKTETDGAGNVTSYAYDPLGRLSATTDPLGRTTSYAYDALSRLVAMKAPDGMTTRYSYDTASQLSSVSYSDGTTTVSYSYDSLGRRISMRDGTGTTRYSYDGFGYLTSVINGAGAMVSYTYDSAGRKTRITYPSAKSVSYTYDPAGQMTSLTDWLGHTTSFSYDRDGNLVSIQYPNGVGLSAMVDARGLLTGISLTRRSNHLQSFSYGYDNRDQLNFQKATGAISAQESYSYDSLGRLNGQTEIFDRGAVGSFGSGFDKAGNLTDALNGATQAFDAASQLCFSGSTMAPARCGTIPAGTTGYTYDARGNRISAKGPSGTTTYTYNGANELTTISGKVTYRYDGDGLRMSKTVGGTTSAFTYDQSGTLPLILSDSANFYLYGPGGIPVEQVGANGTVTYLHQDQLGSTRVLTDQNGSVVGTATYDVYGHLDAKTGTTTPLGYAGQYTDAESGLIWMRARYYDPQTSQFLRRDPLVGLTGQPYAYAGGDPLNSLDPSGLDWISTITKLPGAAGKWVLNNASTISTYTGDAAVAVAFIPIVGEVASPVLGGISLATGGIAAVQDFNKHNWVGLAFDAASLIPGGVSEARSLRPAKELEKAAESIKTYSGTSTTELLALIDKEAQFNNSDRIYRAWGDVYGFSSAGIATMGYLTDKCGIDDLLNAKLRAFTNGN